MSKKVLIGSIFMSTDDTMCRWLDLQLQFIRATTEDFDHVSFVTNCSQNSYFTSRTTLIPGPLGQDSDSYSHLRGLMVMLHHFRKNRNNYDYFLFLDMDAFPIRKGWLGILESKMKDYEIAIPIRTENLETRIHSSILLAKPEALEHLWFDVSSVGKDMMGNSETDVHVTRYQNERRDLVYPLLRSNQYNMHPLLFGIYYDLFYHNSCGTGRRFNMRARPYWEHMTSQEIDVLKATESLFTDPTAFIRKLAGYNIEEYAKI